MELDDEIQNYKNLGSSTVVGSKPPYKPEKLKVEEYEEPYTKEHLKYEIDMNKPMPIRQQILPKDQEPKTKAKAVPGIVNSQKKIEEVKLMQIKRRSTAATKIQKVYKGVQARRNFKKLVQKKNIQDEEDYGYFEVTEQGVKQFLESRKQKLEDERIKKQAIQDLTPEDITQDKFLMHDLRNEHDEFNILNIFYNKSNGKDPFASPEPSMMTMADTPTRTRSIKKKRTIEKYNAEWKADDLSGSIKESISEEKIPSHKPKRGNTKKDDDYSDDFESGSIRESIVQSPRDRKSDLLRSTSEISESIQADKNKKKSTLKDSIEEDIMEESLANKGLVESIIGTDRRKRKSVNFASTESIKEEISGSGKLSSKIKDSIPEEIYGSDVYTDHFESGSLSQNKADDKDGKVIIKQTKPIEIMRSEYPQSMKETKEDIELRRKLEKKYGLNMPDTTENLIFDLVNAKGIYEESWTAMHLIDKFERMLSMHKYQSQIGNSLL